MSSVHPCHLTSLVREIPDRFVSLKLRSLAGPAIFVYGHAGPSYGSYEIHVDSTTTTLSAYSAANVSTPHLLFGASNLSYGVHNIELRNLGARGNNTEGNTLLFDYLQTTVQVAPAGYVVLLSPDTF